MRRRVEAMTEPSSCVQCGRCTRCAASAGYLLALSVLLLLSALTACAAQGSYTRITTPAGLVYESYTAPPSVVVVPW